MRPSSLNVLAPSREAFGAGMALTDQLGLLGQDRCLKRGALLSLLSREITPGVCTGRRADRRNFAIFCDQEPIVANLLETYLHSPLKKQPSD
jgi:hypothetical protein